MKLFAALILLLGVSTQVSAAPSSCLDKYEALDNTMIQSIPGHDCMVTVSPRSPNGMTYRSFLFDSTGLFMIFNSLGNGPDNEDTGAREFFMFPRLNDTVTYSYDPSAKRLSVQTPSGKVFVFNTEKAILVSISDTTFTMDYDVTRTNKGGVEITKNNGLYLDIGYQAGQSPSQNPKRRITFRDAQNNACTVVNGDVFKYSADGDVDFKHTDAQLKSFLSRKCPRLKL
ncbi:hypothetical protein [Bdellovibrio sp. HCB337]|uniref:hypothetical protein n=1 Tax=Bdellovibrio sp. HCB337 TaxID=3394358 RepID=UPI0039A6375B